MNTSIACVVMSAPAKPVAGVVAHLERSNGLELLVDISNTDGYLVFNGVPVPFVGKLKLTCGVQYYERDVNITEINTTLRVGDYNTNPQDIILDWCVPSFKKPGRDQIVNVQANFCNLLDSEGWVIFDNFIDALIVEGSSKADEWVRTLKAAGSTHITLDLSGDYNEPLNWTPRYPLPGHDWTNDLLGFSQILDWTISRGLIPIVKLATDGLGYDPVGMTYGWQWGMDNLPRILSSLSKYHTSCLWSPTWDGGFPVWTPDQTLQMLRMLRSVLGTEACIDMEFGSPPSESISYCHMGRGQADWTPDKLGDLDTFSLELQTYPPVEEGIREAATRLLGPAAIGGIPTTPFYLIDAKTKPIFFETTAYWSMRKYVSNEQNRDVSDIAKKYGFSSFGNGLPH